MCLRIKEDVESDRFSKIKSFSLDKARDNQTATNQIQQHCHAWTIRVYLTSSGGFHQDSTEDNSM